MHYFIYFELFFIFENGRNLIISTLSRISGPIAVAVVQRTKLRNVTNGLWAAVRILFAVIYQTQGTSLWRGDHTTAAIGECIRMIND